MTLPIRYEQPGDSARILPLGIDPATGFPIHHDLDQHPHLLIPATGARAATSTLRLIATYTAVHGAEVTLLTPVHAGYDGLTSMSNVRVSRNLDRSTEAIHDFVDSMDVISSDFYTDGVPLPYRALLVIEHLDVLTTQATHHDGLARALTRLKAVIHLGGALRHHLVAATGRYTPAQLYVGLAREQMAVLSLGARTATEQALLQIHRQPRPGAALLRLPGQHPTELQLTFLSPDDSHQLIAATN
ncbi:hypothetical protein OS965_32830 [Streptomyces sp. H27-G5]|uniref:hypothetical protein n=1 Tax=Streptomyces sp. H27-G5 TaxID=2996698 RepID=UPI00227139FE|nr:hypothetical protein [Streptomyces sp. H27-G5]MCY0922875.1 hypothetical protein [Streptomyces sp. H27-G5]